MTRRLRSTTRAGLLGIAAIGLGCNLLIGLDLGTDKPVGTGGGTGGGTSSSASSGGAGGISGAGGGVGGVGGAGGAGGAMFCVPGTMVSCYAGPPATVGVGDCKAGQQTCVPDGSAYGACMGAVLPAPESCSTAGDEDCDGIACSDAVWAEIFGSGVAATAASVAVDGQGNIVVLASLEGSALFSAPVLVSAGGTDVVIAKLDPTGKPLWEKRYGDAANQFPVALAVDAQDNILVTGQYNGTLTFGAGTLTSAGSLDVFVAKLGPDGTAIWSKSFGDLGAQHAGGIAVDPSGAAIITGDFRGMMTFGATMLTATTVPYAYVAKLAAADGSTVWARQYGDATNAQPTVPQAVAVDAMGGVVFSGLLSGTVSFGGANLVGLPNRGTFLVKLDAAGSTLWSKVFVAAASATASRTGSVSVTPTGHVLIAGEVGGAVDFGGGPTASGGLFAAQFGAAGAHLWDRIFGGTAGSSIVAALDVAGNVALAGGFKGIADFSLGVSPLNDGGMTSDTFVAKLDPGGAYLWSKMFADTADDLARGLAVDPASGRLVIVGRQQGTTDYGTGMLAGVSSGSLFVAELQP